MQGTIELNTSRLRLRRFRMEDAPQMYRLFGADREMYRYSGWNPYPTPQAAAATVRRFMDSYGDPASYSWVIEWKHPAGDTETAAAGTIGAYDYDGEADTIEAGLSIRHDLWGQGLASEALCAVLKYLTEEEGIGTVTAWCAAENTGSRRAMEKAGMQQESLEPAALRVGDAVYDKLVYTFRLPADLTFRMKTGTFNYRVGAIILHGGRLLLMKNSEEPYYYSVGGRVRFNETTEEAVRREVREEIGIDLEIDRFLFFQEQFFDGKVTGTHIHELGVYYLMKDSGVLDNMERLTCRSVTARGVAEELVWLPLNEIHKYYLVPESVAARLQNLPEHPEHLIEIDER